MGQSSGGFHLLSKVLCNLPDDFSIPVLVVQHRPTEDSPIMASLIGRKCTLSVVETEDKMELLSGHVYLAPPNYHLLVENKKLLALSTDEMLNYSRPAIDYLFTSAAEVFRDELIGILMSGANDDGAKGLKLINELGGATFVQDPKEAEFPLMPQSALDICEHHRQVKIEQLTDILVELCKGNSN